MEKTAIASHEKRVFGLSAEMKFISLPYFANAFKIKKSFIYHSYRSHYCRFLVLGKMRDFEKLIWYLELFVC